MREQPIFKMFDEFPDETTWDVVIISGVRRPVFVLSREQW